MSRIKWTEEELASHLKKPGARVASSFGGRLVEEKTKTTKKIKITEKPKSSVKNRADQVSQTIRNSKVKIESKKGEFIKITFDGAKMLSINEIYALNPFNRIGYKKSWHEKIEESFLLAKKKIELEGDWLPFDRFKITAFRRSAKLCDTDALNGFFKYAIDGLRYSGVITEDNPKHFVCMVSSQEVGESFVSMKIEVVNKEEKHYTETNQYGKK